MDKRVTYSFSALVSIFLLTIVIFVSQESLLVTGLLALGSTIIAGLLIYFLRNERVKEELRNYLLLTAWSVIGIPVSTILHNLVYALGIVLFGPEVWGPGGDEPIFFILALIVLPVTFLIGVIGSLVKFFKN